LLMALDVTPSTQSVENAHATESPPISAHISRHGIGAGWMQDII
jgi:hypothetical protein